MAGSFAPITVTETTFASFEDWDLEDPKGKSISFMRQIRDKIEIKIKERFKDY